MSDQALYWDTSYEIILALMDAYPDATIDDIGTQQLLTMIVNLPGFADDPALANEAILNGILRDWYEENNPA